mmetsp:Transcript_30572/g.100243  ORF Transcript_30572/g.100243 Transcript_30572/m.100243 type:complete len:309 (-) Transcript_30572:1580-2506(-)
MRPDMEKKRASAAKEQSTARHLWARRSRPKQHRVSAAPGASSPSPPPSAAGWQTGAASSSTTTRTFVASADATTARKTSSSLGCSRLKSATPSAFNFPPSAKSFSSARNVAPTRPSTSGTSSSSTRFLRSARGAAPGTRSSTRRFAAAASSGDSSPPVRRLSVHAAPNLALRLRGVPKARSWPWAMMATRVHSASASSMECVVSTTARPTIARRSTVHRRRRETGSSPADGSSSNTTSGSPTRAQATHSFRFMPPLRRLARRSGTRASSTSSKNASTTAFRAAPLATLWRAVRRSRNRSRCSRQDSLS